MSLQDIFYIVGIIFMTILIILMAGIIVLLFYIKSKITELTAHIERKITETKEAVLKPQKIAGTIGAALANIIFRRFRKYD